MEPFVFKFALKAGLVGGFALVLVAIFLRPGEFVLALIGVTFALLITWCCEERPESRFGRWLRR